MKETVMKGCCFNNKMYLISHNILNNKIVLYKASEFFVIDKPIHVFDLEETILDKFKLYVLEKALIGIFVSDQETMDVFYMTEDEKVMIVQDEGATNILNKLMENFTVLYDDILGLNPKYINKEFSGVNEKDEPVISVIKETGIYVYGITGTIENFIPIKDCDVITIGEKEHLVYPTKHAEYR